MTGRALLAGWENAGCLIVTARAYRASSFGETSRTTRKPMFVNRPVFLKTPRTAVRCRASRHMKQPPRITWKSPGGATGSSRTFFS